LTKRIVSVLLCALLLALTAPTALAAQVVPVEDAAANNYIFMTLEAGDNIYDLCRTFGVDYIAAKPAIMELNGWTQESEMNYLCAGDTVALPLPGYAAAITTAPETNTDVIAYYVVPYVIQPGDRITQIYENWGLRFERYAVLIKTLNCVENLDVLEVGTVYYLPTTAENVYGNDYITVMSHQMRYGENAYTVFSAYGIDYNENLPILEAYNGGADLARIPVGGRICIPLL
jgi:hypothetical protein